MWILVGIEKVELTWQWWTLTVVDMWKMDLKRRERGKGKEEAEGNRIAFAALS